MPKLFMSQYSEKAIVVRPILTPSEVTDLISLGGKWNEKLAHGPGWIFPATKSAQINNYKQTGVLIKPPIIKQHIEEAPLAAAAAPKFEYFSAANEVTGQMAINKIKRSDLDKAVKDSIISQLDKSVTYYGWHINKLYDSKGIPPVKYDKFSIYERRFHAYIDLIYGESDKVTEWLDSIVIIHDPYGPIVKKYSLYGGKMAVYYKSHWTGD